MKKATSRVNALYWLCSRFCLSINFVYDKYTTGIAYVFSNTHGTHKVYSRYTQGETLYPLLYDPKVTQIEV